MSMDEKITEDLEIAEPPKPKRRFKLDKKHIQGFIAGILLCAIAFIGLYYGTDGRFFKGFVFGDQILFDGPNISAVADFENEVINSKVPVHVTFYTTSPGSGSSKQFADKINKYDLDYRPAVRFFSVNVSDLPEVANRYSIEVYPTCVVFNHGEIVIRNDGPLSDPDFFTWFRRMFELRKK